MSGPTAHPDSPDWHYQLLGMATGPVSADRMCWLIEQGHLVRNSLVSCGPDGPWRPLEEVSEFEHLLPASQADPAAVTKTGAVTGADRPASGPLGATATNHGSAGNVDERIPGIELDLDAAESETQFNHPRNVTADEIAVADDPADARLSHEPVPVTIEPPAPAVPLATRMSPDSEPARRVTHAAAATPEQPACAEQHRASAQWLRSRSVRYSGAALLAVVLIAFAWKQMQPDGRTAHAVLQRVWAELQAKSQAGVSEDEWSAFLQEARADVAAELHRLQSRASADKPGLQALLWAGEELESMLDGDRRIPPIRRVRFLASMAEYEGKPFAAESPGTTGAGPGTAQPEEELVVQDPLFQ